MGIFPILSLFNACFIPGAFLIRDDWNVFRMPSSDWREVDQRLGQFEGTGTMHGTFKENTFCSIFSGMDTSKGRVTGKKTPQKIGFLSYPNLVSCD